MASGTYLTSALGRSVHLEDVLKAIMPDYRQGAYILDYLNVGYGMLTINQKKMVREFFKLEVEDESERL